MYISHMRDEGKLLEAIDELIEISKDSGAPAEIYHFKQAGLANWEQDRRRDRQGERGARLGPQDHRRHVHLSGKLDRPRRGFPDMDAGRRPGSWIKRLKDPATRERAIAEMKSAKGTENAKLVVDDPEKVLLVGFKTARLKPLTGKTLAEVARQRGKPPAEVAADLIVETGRGSRSSISR
jgi:N-acyl-D-aspartate/D-glutamate deacylase